MTNRSPNAVRSRCAAPPRPEAARRRAVRSLAGGGRDRRSGGVDAKGLPASTQPRPGRGQPAARAVPDDRLAVAVVLGASGSVITDALGPYEVFARSPQFLPHGVGQPPDRDAVGWVGPGPRLLAGRRRRGPGARPDVVVVPAVAAPNGKKEAPLRGGSPAGSTGERTFWACATAGGCWQPRACSMVAGPPRTGRPSGALSAAVPRWTGSAASATSRTAPSPPPPG